MPPFPAPRIRMACLELNIVSHHTTQRQAAQARRATYLCLQRGEDDILGIEKNKKRGAHNFMLDDLLFRSSRYKGDMGESLGPVRAAAPTAPPASVRC